MRKFNRNGMNKRVLILIILVLFETLSFAQENTTELRKADFHLTSKYYNGDLILKTSIYKFLITLDSAETLNADKLLQQYIEISRKNNIKTDSTNQVAVAINSLGKICIEITDINKNGNISYRETYCGNLHITRQTGILKRK